jgi:hypothetical protein
MTKTERRSTSGNMVYSVSDGSSTSRASTLGQTSSKGVDQTLAENIGVNIEASLTYTNTRTDGSSQSDSYADSITKSTDLQIANAKSKSSETNQQNGRSTDFTSQNSWNMESTSSNTFENNWSHMNSLSVEGRAEVKYGVAEIGPSGSISLAVTATDQNTKGGSLLRQSGINSANGGFISNSVSNTYSMAQGHSDSDTRETRKSDGISDSKTSTKTNETSYQNSDAFSNGNSKTETFGKTNTYSNSATFGESAEKTLQEARNVEMSNSTSTGFELSFDVSTTFPFPAGSTVVGVNLFTVKSTQVQWSCRNSAGAERILFSDVATITEKDRDQYIQTILKVEQVDNYYEIIDDAFNGRTVLSNDRNYNGNARAMTDRQMFSVDKDRVPLQESNNVQQRRMLSTPNYELFLTGFGDMYIKAVGSEEKLWSTDTFISRTTDEFRTNADGTVTKVSKGSVRVIINEMGHILIQADKMFTNAPFSPYNQTVSDSATGIKTTTTYTTIWSNVPKHMKYQVGTRRTGYVLLLKEFMGSNGGGVPDIDLVLYDGGGSIVWCARNVACVHPRPQGYRFPELYYLPTDFVTDTLTRTPDDALYPHNYIDPSVEFVSGSTGLSENQQCLPILTSGQGMKSPNGRFKLILEESGNVVFKDGVRTMWESFTANKEYAQPPYSMHVSVRGAVYVIDAW